MHNKINFLALSIIAITVCFLCSSSPCLAQSGEEDLTIDDIFNEFDTGTDESFESPPPLSPQDKPSMFSLKGFVKTGAVYNVSHDRPQPGETDWRGLSSLYGEMKIELKAKFFDSWRAKFECKGIYDLAYESHGRDEYTDDVLDEYEKEGEILEAYIQGSLLDNLDIKLGRQIAVWGKSDIIRVTDILNPLNTRELGLTEVEDLRLPVSMARIDYYIGDWNISGMAIPEIRFNKNPEYGSDFYPYKVPPPHEDKPSDGGDNTEYAMAVNGIFSGWDISFYFADIFDDMPNAKLISIDPISQIAESKTEHASITMYGAAFNIAMGNFLLKTEAAYIDGLELFNYPTFNPYLLVPIVMTQSKEYSRTDVLLGLEYTGFNDTTISIEVANKHINNHKDGYKAFIDNWVPFAMANPTEFAAMAQQFPESPIEDQFQSALLITRTFLNETLTFTLIVSAFNGTGQGGSFGHFKVEYDINDNLNISGGIALYQEGDYEGLENIGDNDRISLDIKYSF